jgi:hypothetical protein
MEMAQHDHKEESNLGTGLLGFGIGFVWLLIVIYVSHLMALSMH